MMEFAVPIWRSYDPTKNIDGVKPRKTPGHHTWTDAEIKQHRDYQLLAIAPDNGTGGLIGYQRLFPKGDDSAELATAAERLFG